MARKILIMFFVGICLAGMSHELKRQGVWFAKYTLVSGCIICVIAFLSEVIRDCNEAAKPRKTEAEICRQKRLDAYSNFLSLFWWR